MSLESPKVAIVLVNWNGHIDTVQCIHSIQQATYKNYKIIVVDNGSEPDSVEYIRKQAHGVDMIELTENTGFTGGNNAGISKALDESYEVIILLNNDTTVEPDFIEPLVAELSLNHVGAVQPKICYLQEKGVIWNAGGRYNHFLGLSITRGKNKPDNGRFDNASDTDWITGCCLATTREVLGKVGLLDQQFFAYFEDVDLSFRMTNCGYVLRYQPKSKIYHAVSMSSRDSKGGEGTISPRVIYYNVRNHIMIVRRYARGFHKVTNWLYQLGKIGAYAAYFLLRGRRRKLSAVFEGVKDSLSVG